MRASHLFQWALPAVRGIIDAHKARFGEYPVLLEIDRNTLDRLMLEVGGLGWSLGSYCGLLQIYGVPVKVVQ